MIYTVDCSQCPLSTQNQLDSIDEFEVNTRSEKMIYTMDGEEVHMIPMHLDYCYNRVVLPLRNSDEGKYSTVQYSTVCLSPMNPTPLSIAIQKVKAKLARRRG